MLSSNSISTGPDHRLALVPVTRVAGNEKIRETAELHTNTGAAEVRADTSVPQCTRYLVASVQAPQRLQASAGAPVLGLAGPPGEGQRAGHQPSTVAYRQASDGLHRRGQESRSDANPSPNYLKALPPVAVPRGIAWYQHQHHFFFIWACQQCQLACNSSLIISTSPSYHLQHPPITLIIPLSAS